MMRRYLLFTYEAQCPGGGKNDFLMDVASIDPLPTAAYDGECMDILDTKSRRWFQYAWKGERWQLSGVEAAKDQAQRARIVEMAAQGHSILTTAQTLGLSPLKVRAVLEGEKA